MPANMRKKLQKVPGPRRRSTPIIRHLRRILSPPPGAISLPFGRSSGVRSGGGWPTLSRMRAGRFPDRSSKRSPGSRKRWMHRENQTAPTSRPTPADPSHLRRAQSQPRRALAGPACVRRATSRRVSPGSSLDHRRARRELSVIPRSGGPCSCVSGPECRIVGLDARAN